MPRLDPARARRNLARRAMQSGPATDTPAAAQLGARRTGQPGTKPGAVPVSTRPSALRRSTAAPFASDLEYLDGELRWVEARCRRIGLERRLHGGAEAEGWRPHRRRRRASAPEPTPAARGDQVARLERLRTQELDLRHTLDARLVKHRESGAPTLTLDALCDLYELDAFERSVLLLASALCFSRGFRERFGDLHDADRASSLEVETVFNFHQLGFVERIARRRTFSPTGRLLSNELISMDFAGRYSTPQDLLTSDVEISPRTFSALLGEDHLPAEFLEFSSLEEPQVDLAQVVLAADDKRRILSVVDRHDDWLDRRRAWGIDARIPYGRGTLMLFHGAPGTGKTMTAHAVAKRLGKRVLNVDIPTFLEARQADHFLPGLFREARLQNAVLFFDECEVIFGDRRKGNALMTLLLTEVERFEGLAVLATNLPGALDEALDRRLLVRVGFPKPDRAARREIWRWHLPPETPLAADVDLDALADRYELTGGLIKNAVLMAVAGAVYDSADVASALVTQAQLERAAREQLLRPRPEAEGLSWPRVRLSDVVLPERLAEQVAELVASARNQRTVLDRWGIGQQLSRGKGLTALLSGPPGTGKTLTAEALASELGRPLLAVSASGVLSKWVGDTERRLVALFETCRERGAVLFLDECDSLLGRRGENAPWAVPLVTTLLRLIERHEGVVLLASNRPDALDGALTRRLSHHLRFAAPGVAAQRQIWRGLLPASVPTEGELDLGLLARRFPLTGAAIQNAVFRAAFRAAHEGRALRQRDLERAAAEQTPTDVRSGDLAPVELLSRDGVEA